MTIFDINKIYHIIFIGDTIFACNHNLLLQNTFVISLYNF